MFILINLNEILKKQYCKRVIIRAYNIKINKIVFALLIKAIIINIKFL